MTRPATRHTVLRNTASSQAPGETTCDLTDPILFRATPIVAAALLALAGSAFASSHREAPFISTSPKVDASDFYMFNSYETGRAGFVTLVANYQPLQDGFDGPNYHAMDAERAVRDPHRQRRRRQGTPDVPVPLPEQLQRARRRPSAAPPSTIAPLQNGAVSVAARPAPAGQRDLHADDGQRRPPHRHRRGRSPTRPPARPPSTSRSTTSARRRSPTTRPTPPRTSTRSHPRLRDARARCSSASARIRSRSTSA